MLLCKTFYQFTFKLLIIDCIDSIACIIFCGSKERYLHFSWDSPENWKLKMSRMALNFFFMYMPEEDNWHFWRISHMCYFIKCTQFYFSRRMILLLVGIAYFLKLRRHSIWNCHKIVSELFSKLLFYEISAVPF